MPRNHFLYFGREIAYTDRNGTEYPASFWKLDDFHNNTDRREMTLVYIGWKSKEEFDSGAASLANVGARREHTFTGEAYDKLIAMFAQQVAGVALAGWQIVDLVKDTPNDANEFESFFAGAGEIIAPPELQSLFKK